MTSRGGTDRHDSRDRHDRDLPPSTWPAPRLLRYASGWTLRVLVVAAGVVLLFLLLGRLWIVTVAFVAALLLTALVSPLTDRLRRRGAPDAVSALVGVLTLLAVLAAAAWFVVRRALSQLGAVQSSLAQGVDQIRNWLVGGPLGLSPSRVDDLRGQIVSRIFGVGGNGSGSPLLSNAMLAVDVASAAVLALFLLFFFAKDGPRMWAWLNGLFAPPFRDDVAAAASEAWSTLRAWVLGTTLVALLDAVGIGLALLLIGVPLVVPLAVLTFFAAYVPVIGAVAAGAVATLVALVTQGLPAALLTLGAVILVQQLEGNLFQPLIMGRVLSLHPVVILVAVTGGWLLAGVLGAVVAVPLTAVVHSAGSRLLQGGQEEAGRDGPGPAEGADGPGRSAATR